MALTHDILPSISSTTLLNQRMSISKGSFPSVIINDGIKYSALCFMCDSKILYLPLITILQYDMSFS